MQELQKIKIQKDIINSDIQNDDNISFSSPRKEQQDQKINEVQNEFEYSVLNCIYLNQIEEIQNLKLHLRNLNFLLNYKNIPIDIKISPLILACFLGRLNENIDVDLASVDSGFTSLMIACMSGYFEITQLLIQQGADVNQISFQGQIPLLFCFSRLEEDKNHFENKRICYKLAYLILKNGGEIDKIVNQKKGYTILMAFVSVKYQLNKKELDINLSTIKFLIEHGSNKCLKSAKGKTCFELAEKHQNKEDVQHILNTFNQKYFSINLNLSEKKNIKQQAVCSLEMQSSQNQCCSIIPSCCRISSKIKNEENINDQLQLSKDSIQQQGNQNRKYHQKQEEIQQQNKVGYIKQQKQHNSDDEDRINQEINYKSQNENSNNF